MPGAGQRRRCHARDAGQRRPTGWSEARGGCRWRARGSPTRPISRAGPCRGSCLAVQALLLALMVFADQGHAAASGRFLRAESGEGVECPPGYEYDSFDGSCERDIRVHPRTRLIAMSIATMIGVGMPILFCLLLATCHIGLWDDLSGDGEEEKGEESKDMPAFEKVNSLGKTDSDGGPPYGHQGPGYIPPIGAQDPADVGPPNQRGSEITGALGETTAEAPRSPSTDPRYQEYEERPYSGRKPSNCGVESWLISIPTETGPDYGSGSYLTNCSSATPV